MRPVSLASARLALPATALALALACTGGGTTAPTGPQHPLPTPAEMVGTKLAVVDGHPVGSIAWEAEAARERPENGVSFSSDEKKALLDEAIDQELLFREAFSAGLYNDPKVRRIMINQLLRSKIYESVNNEDFTEAKLKAYFDEHKDDFVIPRKVQVARIFVAVNDTRDDAAAKAKAEQLYAQVKADPETFRETAIANSDGPFARRGGDLGYLDKTGKPGLPAPVVVRAFAMDEGEISEPFLAAGGYNIVYVPGVRERIERTFEQMRGAVLRQIKVNAYEEMTEDFVAELREKAKIEVDEAALQAFAPEGRDTRPQRDPTPSLQYDDEGNIVGGMDGDEDAE